MPLPESRTPEGAAGLAALLMEPARALVATDFDGTLAPIVGDPESAAPAPGAIEALVDLAGVVGSVVVVTGRGAANAVRLAGLEGVAGLERLVLLGHYGLERWDAATGRVTTPDRHPGVAVARELLPPLLRRVDGARFEDKGHSVAAHTRGAPDPLGALEELRGPLAELAAETGLEAAPGRLVVELRPPGTDKGAALRAYAAEVGAGSVLFAGDDLGDLPAFAAVAALRAAGVPGVTVCSASAEVAEVADRADLVVDGPAGVVALFRALVTAIGTP